MTDQHELLHYNDVGLWGGRAYVTIDGHPIDDYAHDVVSVTVYYEDDTEAQFDGGGLTDADIMEVIAACGGESAIQRKAADQRASRE